MNRRSFFQQLASGLMVAAAPALFLPKLVKPTFKDTLKYAALPMEAQPEGFMFISYTIRSTASGIEVIDTSGLGPQPVSQRPEGAFAAINYKLDGSSVKVAWDDLAPVEWTVRTKAVPDDCFVVAGRLHTLPASFGAGEG